MTKTDCDWTSEKFWKRPVVDKRRIGDPNQIPIWTSVGMALSRWENIEERIAWLFAIFCSDRGRSSNHSHLINSHMFGITESSAARIRMVRVAASLYFGYDWEHELVRRPFKEIFKALSDASHRRNEIAHGQVTSVSVQQKDGAFRDSGYFLTAPQYAISRQEPLFERTWDKEDVLGGIDPSEYRYVSSDIFAYADKFRLLSSKIDELAADSAMGERNLPKIVARLYEEGRIRSAF